MSISGYLQIQGTDAQKFLQGQLTCDMMDVTHTQATLGAQCNPQGRIISLFHIVAIDNGYLLKMVKTMVPITIAALKKFAVFFKVTLTDDPDAQFPVNLPSHHQNILAGIPQIYPETSGKFLPHDLNLPELNAVSFTKGCYTGQEIIARMQYRGKIKNRLYRARVQTSAPLTLGQDLFMIDNIAGVLVDFCQTSHNCYDLLVITQESILTTKKIFIDSEMQNALEFF